MAITRSAITRSASEKNCMMAIIVDEQPKLPYPTTIVKCEGYENEELYVIPEGEREAVFNNAYPFMDLPNWNSVLYDVHEGKYTQFSQCQIIRWRNRNILVSEFYFKSGGTCLDLIKGSDWDDAERDFYCLAIKR